MNISQRIDQPELMDTVHVPSSKMKETLDFLAVTNRHFGGTAVILKYLKRWSVKWKADEVITILDVGTGGGEIPVAIAQWARQAGLKVHITAIDLVAEAVDIAKENTARFPEVSVHQKDFFAIASEGQTFDYVIASLFLHHVSPGENGAVIQAFNRLAKRGMIMSDLMRSRAGYWAVTLLSLLIGNDIVRHDGPLSVRRAFRIAELENMSNDAGLHYLRAQKESWFRVSLAGEKTI